MTLKLIGILLCIWMLTVVREIRTIKNRLSRLEWDVEIDKLGRK